MVKILSLAFFKKYDYTKGVFMSKSKSLGYQIHSVLAEIKTMSFLGCRIFELIDIKAEDVNLDKYTFETTPKDGKTYNE